MTSPQTEKDSELIAHENDTPLVDNAVNEEKGVGGPAGNYRSTMAGISPIQPINPNLDVLTLDEKEKKLALAREFKRKKGYSSFTPLERGGDKKSSKGYPSKLVSLSKNSFFSLYEKNQRTKDEELNKLVVVEARFVDVAEYIPESKFISRPLPSRAYKELHPDSDMMPKFIPSRYVIEAAEAVGEDEFPNDNEGEPPDNRGDNPPAVAENVAAGEDSPKSEENPEGSEDEQETKAPTSEVKQEEGLLLSEVEGHDRPLIKGGTLEKLVERLSYEKYPDQDYVKEFMLTYRTFTTGHELLQLLLKRFSIQPDENMSEEERTKFVSEVQVPVRLRVYNVLKWWGEKLMDDFLDDPDLLEEFYEITNGQIVKAGGTFAKLGIQLLELFTRNKTETSSSVFDQIDDDMQIEDWGDVSVGERFLSFTAEEVARHFSIEEHSILKRLRPVELLDQSWTKKDKATKSPNVIKSIKRFNWMAQMVSSLVLSCEKPSDRTQMISRFIEVCEQCVKLGNFSSFWQIIVGLQFRPVRNLKKDWSAVNGKLRDKFEQMQETIGSHHNYHKYRSEIGKLQPPFVPYLGLVLTDLTFSGDGALDFFEDGMINFSKRRRIGKLIDGILYASSKNYPDWDDAKSVRRFFYDPTIKLMNEKDMVAKGKQILADEAGDSFNEKRRSNS